MRTKKQKQASRKNFALCRVIGMRTNLKQMYNRNENINNLSWKSFKFTYI